jgi:hypothetical protein
MLVCVQCFATEFAGDLGGNFRDIFFCVHNTDFRAFARTHLRRRLANPASAAGYQTTLTVKSKRPSKGL